MPTCGDLSAGNAVGFDHVRIFNGYTQTEIGLHPCLVQLLHQQIREGKIVGGRIVHIRIKIPEDVGYIHKLEATESTAYIVEPGIGNTGFGQIMKMDVSSLRIHRGLSACVHGLDFFDGLFGVDCDRSHSSFSFTPAALPPLKNPDNHQW